MGMDNNIRTVTLRRKYFFADGDLKNKTLNQIDAIYSQCLNSIKKEEYPVTKKDAVLLGGTQGLE